MAVIVCSRPPAKEYLPDTDASGGWGQCGYERRVGPSEAGCLDDGLAVWVELWVVSDRASYAPLSGRAALHCLLKAGQTLLALTAPLWVALKPGKQLLECFHAAAPAPDDRGNADASDNVSAGGRHRQVNNEKADGRIACPNAADYLAVLSAQ